MKARLSTDGGARGNPGPAAYGFVLEAADGSVLAARGEAFGVATNNVAEYRGLIAGLEEAVQLGVVRARGRLRLGADGEADARRVPDQERGAARARGRGRHGLRGNSRASSIATCAGTRTSSPTASSTKRWTPREPSGPRAAIEANDVDAVGALLAEDVVFRSPAVYRPYQGRETVVALLGVVAQVFENFRYVNEWRDGATTILFFEANVGDRDLQGIDILEDGADGLVESFTVMIRPLSGLQAVAAAVAARVQIGAQEEAS